MDEDEESLADEKTALARGRTEPTRLKMTMTSKATSPSPKTQRRNSSLAESLAP